MPGKQPSATAAPVDAVPADPARGAPSPLGALLALTFLASLGTGIVWNGIAFIVEQEYRYDAARTQWLYVFMGVLYVVAAFGAGRVLRRLNRWTTPRGFLGWILVAQGLVCLGPLLIRSPWIVWVVTAVLSITAAWLWPVVESYLASGRHGRAMRSALGWWNLTWMAAVAGALFLIAPLLKEHARWALISLAGINGLALLTLAPLRPRPGEHDEAEGSRSITPEYPHLLRSARLLLPLSYTLTGAMSPLLPFLLADLGVPVKWKAPAAATWAVTRILAVALMWRATFWHGRWGTLLLGGLALAGGFGIVVLAPTVGLMLGGFAIFGVGMGIIYYAALYYAMAVGRAAVEAGGTHEGLIGAGYAIGPAAGLFGAWIATALKQDAGTWIVAVVWTLVAAAAIPAVGAYVRARRRR